MNSDTPVVVGAFVTIFGLFIGIAKIMLNQSTKDREADRTERLKLSDAITVMAENSGKQAQATTKGFKNLVESTDKQAREAKERNGHLGDMAAKTLEVVNETLGRLEDYALRADKSLKEQYVKKQVVDKQVIKK